MVKGALEMYPSLSLWEDVIPFWTWRAELQRSAVRNWTRNLVSNSTACLAMAPIQLNTTKQPSSSRVAKAAKPRNTGGSTFLGEKIKASHSTSTVISRAHKCVKEAIKCNYANWKVWDKFMVVWDTLSNFRQEPHLDVQVLTILVDAMMWRTA